MIEQVDRLLERYGGTGAYARADQVSNWFLMSEFEQLKTVSRILPAIFVAVAAFLTNMLLTRLIRIERSEIGLMKAFGYRDFEVGLHYAKIVIVITMIGIVFGAVLGSWLGSAITRQYAEFYRFPFLFYRPDAGVYALAVAVCLGASLAGTLGAVRRAATLPPAEAMRPPAPPVFRQTWFSRTAFGAWLDQPSRMVLRQIARWPARSALTSIGVSLAVGVLIMAYQWSDSIDHLIDTHFFRTQRQDVTVSLVDPRGPSAIHELASLPGVLTVEGMRVVPADFRSGVRRHRGAVEGIRPESKLHLVYDNTGNELTVPPDGLMMSAPLARKLGVSVGDRVWIDVREGRRPVVAVPVTRLFETYIGMTAYMDLDALNRLLGDGPSVGTLQLLVDESASSALNRELKRRPGVLTMTRRRAAVETFRSTVAETLTVTVGFFTGFAAALCLGVVYNSARITLSERGRELATFRVLGFSRAEVSYILLGEVALLILAAMPLGCLAGFGLAHLMSKAFETELYRIEPIIEASTYGVAVLGALTATVLCAARVHRRLDQLDLIAVLKTRE